MSTLQLKYPYELEEVPPHEWEVDGRKVMLSKGWRLKREYIARNHVKCD